MILRFDPDGLGIIEFFSEPGLVDLLPSNMPRQDHDDDAWDPED